MGTYLNRGVNFVTGQQVTAADLQNLVDNATIATGAGDGQTIEITSNTITVANGGISPTKLSTGGPAWDSSGNTTISGNATVTGNTSTVNVTASGTAAISGETTLSNGVAITGALSSGGTLNIKNPSDVSKDVNINGTLQAMDTNVQSLSATSIACTSLSSTGTISGTLAGNGSIHAAGAFVGLTGTIIPQSNSFNIASMARDSSSDSGNVSMFKITMTNAAANTNYIVNIQKGLTSASAFDSGSDDVALITTGLSTTEFFIGIKNMTDGVYITYSVISPV